MSIRGKPPWGRRVKPAGIRIVFSSGGRNWDARCVFLEHISKGKRDNEKIHVEKFPFTEVVDKAIRYRSIPPI